MASSSDAVLTVEASIDNALVTVPEIRDGQLILPVSTVGLTLADYIPVLERYLVLNSAMVFDYRDKKGNAAARSHIYNLRKIKTQISEIHKNLKARYKAIVDNMDAGKRDALEIIEAMIEHHDKELRVVAAEAQKREHLAWIAQKHAECWDLAHQMNDVFDEQKALARQRAEQDRVAAEQAEKQRELDRQQREKEIAENATKEAERKANEKAEAEKQKAAREAQQEEERKRQAEQQAAADQENARRVHWAMIPAMIKWAGVTEDQAKALILAMRDGVIPAVKIDYQWQPVDGGK